jgi:hypothetical protein
LRDPGARPCEPLRLHDRRQQAHFPAGAYLPVNCGVIAGTFLR